MLTSENCAAASVRVRAVRSHKGVKPLLAVAIALFALASHLEASTIISTFVAPFGGNTGNWSDPTAWSPNGVPNNLGSTIFTVDFAPTVNTTTTIVANQEYVVDF